MKSKYIGVIVILFFVSFLVAGCSLTGSAVQKENKNSPEKEAAVTEINIKAFSYGYNPDVINVKKGEKVRIVVDNTDFSHGIRIPDLNVKGIDQVEFTADREGEFTWHCASYCGEGHKRMSGRIIVQS